MGRKNIYEQYETIREIAKKTKLTREIVDAVLDGYHKIIIRELRNQKRVSFKNFASFVANYRKSGLKRPDGSSIVGSVVAKIVPSQFMRQSINSETPIDFDIPVVMNQDKLTNSELRKELKSLRMSNTYLQKKSEKIEKKYKDLMERRLKNASLRRKRSRLKYVARTKNKTLTRHAAAKLLNQKILSKRIDSAYYLDAITAYPVLTKFYKEQSLTINELNMFIIANHFEYFEIKDATLFGIKKNTAANVLKTLVESGLMEEFGQRPKKYTISLIGKKKFTEFSKKINKDMRTLLKNYKNKIEGSSEEVLPVKNI